MLTSWQKSHFTQLVLLNTPWIHTCVRAPRTQHESLQGWPCCCRQPCNTMVRTPCPSLWIAICPKLQSATAWGTGGQEGFVGKWDCSYSIPPTGVLVFDPPPRQVTLPSFQLNKRREVPPRRLPQDPSLGWWGEHGGLFSFHFLLQLALVDLGGLGLFETFDLGRQFCRVAVLRPAWPRVRHPGTHACCVRA